MRRCILITAMLAVGAPGCTPLATTTLSPRQAATMPIVNNVVQRFRTNAERAEEEEQEELAKGYEREKLVAYGRRRPLAVASRVAAFTAAYLRVSQIWEAELDLPPELRTRGDR